MGFFPIHFRKFGKSTSSPGLERNQSNSGSLSSHANSSRDLRKPSPRGHVVSHTPPPSSRTHTLQPQLASSSPTRFQRSLSMPIIAPALLDDPAFSTDPRSHPYFVLAQDVTNPLRSHPKERRVTFDGLGNRLQFRQPPNPESFLAESYSPVTSPFVSPPTTPDSVPSLSSSNSTPSRLSPSSPSPSTPPVSTALPSLQSTNSPQPPPYESLSLQPNAQEAPRPSPVNNTTIHSSRDSRLMQPPTPTESRIYSSGPYMPRVHELDRIDELDETDPLGVPWHHGGPYEAIHNLAKAAVQESAYAKGGYIASISRLDEQQHKSHRTPKYVQSGTVGVSLNLVPGQILPRMPLYDPGSLIPPHPLCQPPSQSHNDDHGRQAHLSQPLPPLVHPQLEPTCYDPYAEQFQQTVGSLHRSSDHGQQGVKRPQSSQHLTPHKVSSDLAHHLDPVHQADHVNHHGSLGNDNRDRPVASHRSLPSVKPTYDPRQQRDQDRTPNTSRGPQKSVSFDTTHHVLNHVRPLNHGYHNSKLQGSPPDEQSTAELDHDPHTLLPDHLGVLRQTSRTLASSGSKSLASTGGHKNGVRHNRYLPTNLIMPTPLQQAKEQHQLPRAAQPHSLSVISDSHSYLDQPNTQTRAQDIPMLPSSRKLRKKVLPAGQAGSSLLVTAFPAAPASSHNTGISDLSSHSKDYKNRAPNRVSSKRRNDL